MRLHHHAIIVNDMDKAIETFCELLGMKFILRHPGVGEIQEVAFVEDVHTGHRLELILKPDGKSGELDHITFEVDDVDIAFNMLKSQGLEVGDEPTDVAEGNFQFKKIHSSGCRLAHLFTPNKLKIQLIKYD